MPGKANKVKCGLESFFIMLVMLPIGILIRLFLYAPLFLLHEIVFFFSPSRDLIKEDLRNFRQWPELMCSTYSCINLSVALVISKEFRNVFYMRVGHSWQSILSFFLPPLKDVYMPHNPNIKGGLCLIHGFGTVINSSSYIGKNCIILHGVTIGEDWKGGTPTIGDNVFIGCNSTIIGSVYIGNNVKVGAGTTVVDNVPDGVTIVSPKAIIKKKGK